MGTALLLLLLEEEEEVGVLAGFGARERSKEPIEML